MEKVRREPVVKTSSMRIFNLVNTQSSQCIYEIFENKLFLKEIIKKITWFFPLHPVTFYGQNFEKQKYLKLVTSLFELQHMLAKISFLVLPSSLIGGSVPHYMSWSST